MQVIRPFYFHLTDDEIDRFLEGSRAVLESGMLILGRQTAEFEERFAEFVGTRHAIAVNSGTSALEILLKIKNVEGKTVLVPTNTNFATAAAVLYARGRVRYLDMDENTFAPTLDMVRAEVERTDAEPVAGLVWVHIGGIVSPEFPAGVEYCRERGLFVIEDAAHAHGSALGGVNAGNLADAGAFSFFPTKVMTTFEGGMITTNDAADADLARSFRNQGKRGVAFGGLHHDLGNSHRITEVGALLGIIQLAKLPEMLTRRQRAYERISRHLAAAGIPYVSADHMDRASHYKLIVRLPDGVSAVEAKAMLAEDGIVLGGGVYEIPCHQQPVFEGRIPSASLPVADYWCPRHICPPLTGGMTDDEADRVGAALARLLRVSA